MGQQAPARLLQGLLSQRKWMNQQLDAKAVIDCTMHLIILLKQEKHKTLWRNIAKHATNFEIAENIKKQHEKLKVSTGMISTANISPKSNGNKSNHDFNQENKEQDADDQDDDD